MHPVYEYFPPDSAPPPGSVHERYVADRLAEAGRWGTATLADRIAAHAARIPDRDAFVAGGARISWRDLHELSDRLATHLVDRGLARGKRVGVLLPDGLAVHLVYLAAQKAGVVVVGIGPRAGAQEIRHLLTVAGATALISHARHRDAPVTTLIADLPVTTHLVVPAELADWPLPPADPGLLAGRGFGVAEVHLLNSTSGTTGMPKCVVHNQNRWLYYHELAVESGELTGADVFLTVIPAPYGFAQWTANFTPALLGSPTVVMSKFSAEGALELIERERVTVLCCVSTQFIMMLNSPALSRFDLSSLRCMFTGGEAVPFERAVQFERDTGAKVLQFFGSNETGALSRTGTTDTPPQRLRSAGRVIDAMNVRLFAEDGADVTATGGPGQAACAGPATCLGYFDDPAANEKLFTPDGWMLTGDICTLDADGYLRVVDRKSDFIIRGGKNISAAAVEDQVGAHPSVAMVAAVAVPDPVYGERVCAVVVLRPDCPLDLDGLRVHLKERGVSPENWPERLEIVADLPRGSGGKVAKAELRQRLRIT